jgi:hypothetical protein
MIRLRDAVMSVTMSKGFAEIAKLKLQSYGSIQAGTIMRIAAADRNRVTV